MQANRKSEQHIYKDIDVLSFIKAYRQLLQIEYKKGVSAKPDNFYRTVKFILMLTKKSTDLSKTKQND